MMLTKNKQTIVYLNSIYILLSIIYYNFIGEKFNYIEYMKFTNIWNTPNFLVGFSLALIFSFLQIKIKDSFTRLIYTIFYLINLIPILVFRIFNYINFRSLVGIISLLLFLYFTQNIKISTIKFLDKKPKEKDLIKILVVFCALISLIFFIKYFKYFNLKNLLLKDIYITRSKFRGIMNPLLGYLFGLTSRVFAPILLVLGIKFRNKLGIFVSLLTIIILFLSGALKSVFFGIILVIIFFKGRYIDKTLLIIRGIFFFYIISLIENLVFNIVFFTNIIRRIFFIPIYLESQYYDYFSKNLTYGVHSFFKVISPNQYSPSISRYFGEKIMGIEGLSANIGVIADGGISFGIFGILLYVSIIVFVIIYIKSLKISSDYFGIIVVYLYYVNTAILTTLFLTHGLIFYIIFANIFFKKIEINT